MLKRLVQSLFVVLLFPSLVTAAECAPWLGTDFVVGLSGTYRFQAYRQVATGHGHYSRKANDNFLTVGASFAGLNWDAEVETTVAHTHRQHPGWDNLRLTGRYRWMNDICAECLTVTPGITLTQACTNSLRDISSFHHGRIEAELHVTIGKECSVESLWISRWWAEAGIGKADIGWPWVRAEAYWERNWLNLHQLRLFAFGLMGFGHHDLHKDRPFRGYGNIRHRSLDLGIRYSHLFDYGLVISGEYAFRVYARNFPAYASQIVIRVEYPISIVTALCR